MYAAAKYGKNMMGSYASQLDIKQRWMVIAYIKKTQADAGGDAYTFGAGDAVAAPAAKTPDTTMKASMPMAATPAVKAKTGAMKNSMESDK